MRLFSRKKIGKIKFILLGLGFFLVSFPVVSVYAVAPTITVGSENSFSTGDSPGLSNIFKITSPEENRILIGCPISTVDGLIGNTLKSIETITYTRFDSGIRELECPSARSDISSAPSNNNGILGVLNMATGSILEQRPASGIQFAEEKIYAITNPGKVYAQDPASYFPGTGFDLLQPIRSFWGWSVNLVFGILIVIILFVAFAIILGDKMPGNMKVTLQSAIPNIALAMILVPLSYSISGLFVDFITIGSNAVHDFVLGPASPGYSVYLEREQGPNDRGLYIDDERLTWINARSQVDVRQEVDAIADSGGINNNLLFQVVATILNVFANEEVSNVGTNPSSASAWLGTIINGILSILMIWIGIRILIRLFKKYLSLIIMPIFSPFIFATIAVPGNGTKPIVTYAKSLAASSLGFIVTYLMFLLTIVFSSTAFQASIPDFRTGLWVPPLLGISQLEGLAGAGGGLGIVPFILGLIGIGIYFSIPKVLDQIDDALGAKFSLPEFVRTPIESFRESARVTRGVGVGAARIGFRGANILRNSPEAYRRGVAYLRSGEFASDLNKRLNFNRNARIARESRAQMDQYTEGSTTYARREELNSQYSGSSQRFNAARSEYQRARARGDNSEAEKQRKIMENESSRMTSIQNIAKSEKITLSRDEKPEEKLDMTVTFKSSMGGDNNIIFSSDYIQKVINYISSTPGRPYVDDNIGKLVFNLKGNAEFSNTDIIQVGGTSPRRLVAGSNPNLPPNSEIFVDAGVAFRDDTGNDLRSRVMDLRAIPNPDLSVNSDDIFSRVEQISAPTSVKQNFGGTMYLIVKRSFVVGTTISADRKSYEIPLTLVINRAANLGPDKGLFGVRKIVNGKERWVEGILNPSPTLLPTNKVAFKIAETEKSTEAFKIFVGMNLES